MSAVPDDAEVLAATRLWIERAVIGLNLCPFSRAPYLGGRVHIAVSHATGEADLLRDLFDEMKRLLDADEKTLETSLLVHPRVLTDFYDFNDFLDVVDQALEELGLAGELQVASFHPDYEFAEAPLGDVANYTNRSPFPTLHLLRESSIDRAVESMENTDVIYERNIERMRALGLEGWRALWDEKPAD